MTLPAVSFSPAVHYIDAALLTERLRLALHQDSYRLGTMTSVDGRQLVTVVLNTNENRAECWLTPLSTYEYASVTPTVPQAHWFERALFDMFGINPQGHPRLKPVILNERYGGEHFPLNPHLTDVERREKAALVNASYLNVGGEGIYEIPVGPVHAGIIEPGHFRLSCLGEEVVNLEIRLGFVHRGVEKRLAEVPWQKARFVAEAAATDTACANALASAVAFESLLAIEVPRRAQLLRAMALEVERLAMHVADVGGMAVDLGAGAVAGALSKLRGKALRLADLLAGSRFFRGFILPGGVRRDPDRYLAEFESVVRELKRELAPPLDAFMTSTGVYERLHGAGVLPQSLAREFGLVGVAARASGIAYDARRHFQHAAYPELAPDIVTEADGDALSRTRVRVGEINTSIELLLRFLSMLSSGSVTDTDDCAHRSLPSDSFGVGVVEAFRGEVIHLICTDDKGAVKRYSIKGPSLNNWTGLAIAVRNNVVQDFPVCNKSFALSYSGHDM